MHADNLSYLVEIGVEGKCTINCKLFQVVQVVHAVRDWPKGITQSRLRNFLINRDLIPQGTMQGNRSLVGWEIV